MKFLYELSRRNAILYYYGWLYFIGGILCAIMTQTTTNTVLGINAWIKPMKFAFSIWIFCWTMAWFLTYLDDKRRVKVYTWMVVVVMLIEQAIITWQAANGRLSHFNITTPFHRSLFIVMGVAIATLTTWTGVIGYNFFKQQQFTVPMPYVWGIRLGIVLFVIFSFEGGIMASRLAHTVGTPDGGPGIPVLNWSTVYGDLRVAHFIGIHSLQLLPLFGYYIARNNRQVQWVAAAYFFFTMFLFVQAFQKIPFLH
ncbi:MAG: hypothetical protein J7621_15795 [Niastella sp.]|nr:hypothetical protein [Niastella sp.]